MRRPRRSHPTCLAALPVPPQCGWGQGGHFWLRLVWVFSGPYFHYSNAWQLVINTGTTIVTFLMVFLIQNTQNRDARAINLKLDELIRAIDSARNQMINIETLSDLELDLLHAQYEKFNARRPMRVAEVRVNGMDAQK
jgi:low affinity Fe/Cu permease